jgi:hypothetical protein
VKTPLLAGEFFCSNSKIESSLIQRGVDMKFPAWYGILVGLLMITQWTLSIVMEGVPEFESAPWEIAFHLAAEVSTSIVLILGGVAALKSIPWSKQVLLLGLGMVIYSEIVSPGYFAQLGQWLFVVMFAILLFGAVWSGISLLSE